MTQKRLTKSFPFFPPLQPCHFLASRLKYKKQVFLGSVIVNILFFLSFYPGLDFFVMTLYYFYYENKKNITRPLKFPGSPHCPAPATFWPTQQSYFPLLAAVCPFVSFCLLSSEPDHSYSSHCLDSHLLGRKLL